MTGCYCFFVDLLLVIISLSISVSLARVWVFITPYFPQYFVSAKYASTAPNTQLLHV